MALTNALDMTGSEPWAPMVQQLLQKSLQRALTPETNASSMSPEDQRKNEVMSYLQAQGDPIRSRFAPWNKERGMYGDIPANQRNAAMTEFVNSLDPQTVGPHFGALQEYMNQNFGGPEATNRWYGQRFTPPAAATVGNILTLGMGGFERQGSNWDQAVQRMNSIANQAVPDQVGMTHGFNSGSQFMRDAVMPIGAGALAGAGLSRVPALARWLGPRIPLVNRLYGASPPAAAASQMSPATIMSGLFPSGPSVGAAASRGVPPIPTVFPTGRNLVPIGNTTAPPLPRPLGLNYLP